MPSQPQQAHYYWVIPIILFIITQTSVAIWWASDLNTSIASLQTQVEVSIRDGEAEDLRQWGRIHTNGIEINNVEQNQAISESQLQTLNENIDRVDESLKENNNLIRELIRQLPAPTN